MCSLYNFICFQTLSRLTPRRTLLGPPYLPCPHKTWMATNCHIPLSVYQLDVLLDYTNVSVQPHENVVLFHDRYEIVKSCTKLNSAGSDYWLNECFKYGSWNFWNSLIKKPCLWKLKKGVGAIRGGPRKRGDPGRGRTREEGGDIF